MFSIKDFFSKCDQIRSFLRVKTEVIFFIPKQDLHPSGGDVCLYHIKILSDISDPEFYSLKTNVYKPSEKFDFPETEWPY